MNLRERIREMREGIDLVESRSLVGWRAGGPSNTAGPKGRVLCDIHALHVILQEGGRRSEREVLPLSTFDRWIRS